MSKVFAYEDGNLASSVRVTRKRLYSDIDLSLAAKPFSGDGDVYKKTDAAAVKQSIKTLILTNRFEKPYRPAFGANLGSRLFELADGNSGDDIIESIKKSIERYEPRAKILNIKVFSNPDYNSLAVTLEFRIINTSISETLNLDLRTPFSIEKVLPTTAEPQPGVMLLMETGGRVATSGGRFLAIDEGLRSDEFRILVKENNDDIITTESGVPINMS